MPGCDISASIPMCAPVTGRALASASLSVTVAGPTRRGCGVISCSMLRIGGDAALEQLMRRTSPAAVQADRRRLLRSLGSEPTAGPLHRKPYIIERVLVVQESRYRLG